MSILAGNVVQVYNKFKDKHGTLINPTAVEVTIRYPDLSETTFVYGVDAEVVRESTGVYYINIDTTGLAGDFDAKWVSTGVGQGVSQTSFTTIAPDISP